SPMHCKTPAVITKTSSLTAARSGGTFAAAGWWIWYWGLCRVGSAHRSERHEEPSTALTALNNGGHCPPDKTRRTAARHMRTIVQLAPGLCGGNGGLFHVERQ